MAQAVSRRDLTGHFEIQTQDIPYGMRWWTKLHWHRIFFYVSGHSQGVEDFTGPESLLKYSKQPAIFPCQPDKIHFTQSYSISFTSILILSYSLVLGILRGLFFFRFPHQNPLCISLLHIRATCPAHLILGFIILIISGEQYKS